MAGKRPAEGRGKIDDHEFLGSMFGNVLLFVGSDIGKHLKTSYIFQQMVAGIT